MSNYIMTEGLFNQLCHISSFNEKNGKTYQEHILIIAGKRIPTELHEIIRKASTGKKALELLDEHNIAYTHKHVWQAAR